MSARKGFETDLQAAWAAIPALAGVRVIATERALDKPDVLTALIRSKGIARSEVAPISHRDVSLMLTLISPRTDLDKAQDELEDIVDPALDHLDTFCRHGEATTTEWNSLLAYDIPITILASKE